MGSLAKTLIALMALAGLTLAVVYLRFTPTGPAPPPLSQIQPPLWEAPDFSLVNCDGHTISKADLAGKVWAVAFIFTRCPGPCPLISQRMTEAMRKLEGIDDFRMVSFTVDPRHDTPEVLADYAKTWKADPKRWYFLTGEKPSDQTMFDLANDFKIAAARSIPETGEDPDLPDITHGTNILLVDQTGWVRAVYDPSDPHCPEWIAQGARQLLNSTSR